MPFVVHRSLRRLVPALLVSALLAACGGGESAAPPQATAAPAAERMAAATVGLAADQGVSPIKSRSVALARAAGQVELGSLPLAKSAGSDRIGAHQVGAGREVAATATADALAARMQWSATATGGQVGAITFSADGAYGLRLGLLVDQLPLGTQLRFYGPEAGGAVFQIAGQEVQQRLQAVRDAGEAGDAARTFWSPEFGGAAVTLEVELPRGTAPAQLRLAVPRVSHIYQPIDGSPAPQDKAIGDSGTCNLDATCYGDYAGQRDAMARMVFTAAGGGTYVCTGTLLNNRSGADIPYFLSAHHCISQQSEATSLQTDWFFRSATCTSRVLNSGSSTRYNGSRLLYAAAATDTSFMQLNDMPPAGTVKAGWDPAVPALNVPAVGVHHPSGDLAKISFGTINGFATCSTSGSFSCQTVASSGQGNFLRVNWSQGTTEGGSSGSALFSNVGGQRFVVGTLRGGGASCSSPTAPDYYGRFDIAFHAGLKTWLDNALPPAPGAGPNGRMPVYRFYNGSTRAHFYTVNVQERNFVITSYPQFAYEGVAFWAHPGSVAGQSPIYRFYNDNTFAHFYTVSAQERDFVLASYPQFRYEGPVWYARGGGDSTATPVFRFYNTATGVHFYTVNQDERDFVIRTYPSFLYEGVAYYAWTSG